MFQNNLHNSADQNTFWIWSLFQASKRGKKSNLFQYRQEGGVYPDLVYTHSVILVI